MNLPSSDTQVALLLTAPLIVGKGATRARTLTHVEFRQVKKLVTQEEATLEDLLAADSSTLKAKTQQLFGVERIAQLLDRGFQLAQAVERWSARSIWVVGSSDLSYPSRMLSRLRDEAPPVLYGCGSLALLDKNGLAIVGSRDAAPTALAATERNAKLAAGANLSVISGGARGVDQTAMQAALASGGEVIGVLADSLESAVLSRTNRRYLTDQKLILLSPFDPQAGFNVGNAMYRNKLIYSMADAALIVSCTLEKGGTWAGATEQLRKYRFVPVYILHESETGLTALKKLGARVWPQVTSVEDLKSVLLQPDEYSPLLDEQPQLALKSSPTVPDQGIVAGHALANVLVSEPERNHNPSDVLFSTVRAILREYKSPTSERQIAQDLNVSIGQARVWLRRLEEEGTVQKLRNPVRYRSAERSQGSLL